MSWAFIPSPQFTAFSVGPLKIHAYALCILLGIVLAIQIGQHRWARRGGHQHDVADIAVWAVPAGIIGGRIYHVITSPDAYFGSNGRIVDVVKIWNGGLGIWGAIAFGALGAWWGHRKLVQQRSAQGLHTPSFATFADVIAPALLVAQAVGRWGNWFNKELFGGPTNLPWGLEIPTMLRPDPNQATYHPTFLYESLWCLALAWLLVRVEKKWRLDNGQLFFLYVAGYCIGRFWWEWLRVDPAHQILGMRVNSWVSLIVGALAIVMMWRRRRQSVLQH